MNATALVIAKGSRRLGRCGRCGHGVTWATLAQRGAKNIPLVAAAQVLRVEHGTNGVAVEIVAFDQVHRCPARKDPAPRSSANRMAPRHVAQHRPADHAYASFDPDRIAELRRRLEVPAPPKQAAPPLEKLW